LTSILTEANDLVNGDRQASYGSPVDCHSRIAAVWNVLLKDNLKDNLSAVDVALLFCAVKLVRESTTHKRDNLVDLCGYAEIADRCIKGDA